MGNLLQLSIPSKAVEVDTDVVPVFQDEGKNPKLVTPGPYSKMVQELARLKSFDGSRKTLSFVRFGGAHGARNVLFVGMGKASKPKAEMIRQGAAMACHRLNEEKCHVARVLVEELMQSHSAKNLGRLALVDAFAEGMILANYQYLKHKSEGKKPNTLKEVFFYSKEKGVKDLADGLTRAMNIAELVYLTRDWSNEPSNYGTPEYYSQESQKLARRFGVKCRVLGNEELQKERMGLFLSVNAGSARPARLVVLEYMPKGGLKKGRKTICLVGKGVTFDTGGISIKPAARMEEMKHDMTGAATVTMATLLAAKMGCENRIVCLAGYTENMPSGNATQPGNVIASRSGKTVEITNTDAEGRLVLADLLHFAGEFKPDAIIDAATLTGAVTIALGRYCCGVLGTGKKLISRLMASAQSVDERMWELPLWDEYLEEMKSSVADLNNISTHASAGTIRGGIFLKQFVPKGIDWAHLDIAATASDVGFLPYCQGKGASGLHVRTLAHFVNHY